MKAAGDKFAFLQDTRAYIADLCDMLQVCRLPWFRASRNVMCCCTYNVTGVSQGATWPVISLMCILQLSHAEGCM